MTQTLKWKSCSRFPFLLETRPRAIPAKQTVRLAGIWNWLSAAGAKGSVAYPRELVRVQNRTEQNRMGFGFAENASVVCESCEPCE